MKRCTMCGSTKPLDEFGPDSRRSDGRKARCRRCLALLGGRPEELARRRERERTPEAKAKRNAHLRRKRAEDQEWRDRQNRIAAGRYERRARSGITVDEVGDRDNWRCYLCERDVERRVAHVDHIIPVARGGTNVIGNLAITHGACNRRKRDAPVGELTWVVRGAADRERRALEAIATEQEPPRMPRRPSGLCWTQADDDALRAAWSASTWAEVEAATGRSVHALRHRAVILGLAPARYRRAGTLLAGVED